MGFVRAPIPPLPEPSSDTKYWYWRSQGYEWQFNPPVTDRPQRGARIQVTSASGTRIVTTDADGMYVVRGLTADDYTLRLLDVPAHQTTEDVTFTKNEMRELRLARFDIYTEWKKRLTE
jgi:hypothetical protein